MTKRDAASRIRRRQRPPRKPLHGAASPLVPAALAGLLSATSDGVALLDDSGRYAYVNPPGCEILGRSWPEIEGRSSFLTDAPDFHEMVSASSRGHDARPRSISWTRDGQGPQRELEYRTTFFDLNGERFIAVTFRDVTDIRSQERQLTAFGRAAASVAYAGSLRATLDAVCDELVRTTRLAAVQILLINPEDLRLQVHGAAPSSVFPADFTVLLEAARQRGAELKSLVALRTKQPVVAAHRRKEMLADPNWEPLHDHLSGFDWDSFVSMPLLFQGESVGILNAYYPPAHVPNDRDITFLGAMADQAAVAVKNARLFAELKGRASLDERHRLARELHDSACQELFSLTLQIRAAQLALARGNLGDASSIARRLASFGELAYSALEDMRGLIFELHPPLLHVEGLLASLRRAAEYITARGDLQVEVQSSLERLNIDADAELEVYRLVREALHNAVKHARASHVWIRVDVDGGAARTLLIEVADDGVGFDPKGVASGLGLVSMRERAERLGAELLLVSRPGAGTSVRASVPRLVRDAEVDESAVSPAEQSETR